jgi:L-asparaginase II
MKLGVALKAEDGAKRAAECALLAVLHQIDAVTTAELNTLRAYAEPAVMNTRQEIVGAVRARLSL